MEYEHDHQYSPSFKNKLKTSIFCCYYSDDTDEEEEDAKALEPSDKSPTSSSPPQASLSTWIKSELPEIKDRCVGIFSGKIGRTRRRGNSAEFGYDPMSYALNFEDDDSRFDEYPLRDFSARLPQSPTPQIEKNVVVSREIAAWS